MTCAQIIKAMIKLNNSTVGISYVESSHVKYVSVMRDETLTYLRSHQYLHWDASSLHQENAKEVDIYLNVTPVSPRSYYANSLKRKCFFFFFVESWSVFTSCMETFAGTVCEEKKKEEIKAEWEMITLEIEFNTAKIRPYISRFFPFHFAFYFTPLIFRLNYTSIWMRGGSVKRNCVLSTWMGLHMPLCWPHKK